MTEDIYKTFSLNFFNYIKKEKSNRKSWLSRCTSALINAKLISKKLLILFGKTMLTENEIYNSELIINDATVTKSAIKLINDVLSNRVKENDFLSKLMNLSKIINFFYQFSKLYAKIFEIETEYYEIFTSLLFQKSYENDKNDYVNSIGILISGDTKDKYQYEELLEYINKNYNNQKDFINEYIRIFLDGEKNYIDKIDEILKKKNQMKINLNCKK